MKSPRNWALQHMRPDKMHKQIYHGRNEKPEKLGIATLSEPDFRNLQNLRCRKEKPEKLGIATGVGVGFATLAKS